MPSDPAANIIAIAKTFLPIRKVAVDGSKKVPISSKTLYAERLTLNGHGNGGTIRLFAASSIAGRYDALGSIPPGGVWECPIPPSGRVDLNAIYYQCPRGDILNGSYVAWNTTPAVKLICGGDQTVLVVERTTAVPTGTPGDVATGTTGILQHCNKGHLSRMRMAGTVTRVEFYIALLSNIIELRVMFYRRNQASVALAGSYYVVGQTENLLDKLRPGYVNTIDLAEPVHGIQDGDYCGFFIRTNTSATTANVLKLETPANWSITNWTDVAFRGTPLTVAAWESATGSGYATAAAPTAYVIGVYMGSPVFVALGDSKTSGTNGESNFLPYLRDESENWNPEGSYIWNLCGSYGVNYQNHGIGGQTSTQIAARIATTTATKAKVCVLEMGVNDLVALGAAGPFTGGQATFIANLTTIFDACTAAGMYVIWVPILPWTNGSNAQMTERDLWNAAGVSLAAGYSNVKVCDLGSTVGQFRGGGAGGNFWDILTAYDYDGAHFKDAGYTAIGGGVKTAWDAYCAANNLAV